MPVKIRLTRRGRKKLAMYDVVIADARAPRDGRFIEKIGTYNPNTNPATINIQEDKALQWLLNGAQPTDTVRAMLSYRGVMLRKHLQIGVLKDAITQEQADKRFEEWLKEKETKISGKIDSLAKQKEKETKERKAAETKVKEAREEAQKAKLKTEEAEQQEAEVKTEETEAQPAAEAAAQQEAPQAKETEEKEATAAPEEDKETK